MKSELISDWPHSFNTGRSSYLGQVSFRVLHCFLTVEIISLFDFTGNTKRVIAYSPKYPKRIIFYQKKDGSTAIWENIILTVII